MLKKVLVAVLMCAAAVHNLSGVDVSIVSGESLTGDNLKIEKGKLTIGEKDIPLEEVILCRWDNEPVPVQDNCIWFSLQNGDRLCGSILKTDGDLVSVRSGSFGDINIDLRVIREITIRESAEKKQKKTDPKKDVLYFVNGDILQGFLNSITDTGVVFESVIGKMHYNFSELSSVRLQEISKPQERPNPYFVLTTVSGDSVSAAQCSEDDGTFQLHSFSLGSIQVNRKLLNSVEVVGGRMVSLSDLPVADSEEKPYWKEGFVWKYRTDRSLDGNVLTIAGRSYKKGFGVHSFCRLEFDLEKKYGMFTSDIGIDDEVSEYGNAVFRVLGDGKVLFEREGVAAGDKPLNLRLDVSEVSRLTLVVDFGENFDIGDHADWADPRLIRKKQ